MLGQPGQWMEAMQVSLQTESGLGFMGVFFREVRLLKSGLFRYQEEDS